MTHIGVIDNVNNASVLLTNPVRHVIDSDMSIKVYYIKESTLNLQSLNHAFNLAV